MDCGHGLGTSGTWSLCCCLCAAVSVLLADSSVLSSSTIIWLQGVLSITLSWWEVAASASVPEFRLVNIGPTMFVIGVSTCLATASSLAEDCLVLRDFKRLKRFLLPPPRYDPHKILKEYDIPEMIVNSLMIRAKERNSTMSYLRGVCYPASLWIPYRELTNTSQVRSLMIMGWTNEVVDGAKEIIYDFIKFEIGEDIYSLSPATNYDVWGTWNSLRNQERNGGLQLDHRAENGSRAFYVDTWRDEPNSSPDEHPEYGDNVEAMANDETSDDETIAEILNLQPLEVTQKLETEEDMDISCEVVNTVTEPKTDKIKEEVQITIDEDKIITWRALNQENPNQGVLYEIIELGMTITCKICCDTEVKGELMTVDRDTKTIIIKPAPNMDDPLNSGKHLINLEHVVDIKIMRVHTRKSPVHTRVNMEEGFKKNKLMVTEEARDITNYGDIFLAKEHRRWDDEEEAQVNVYESEGNVAQFRGEWKQDTVGKYDVSRCTKKKNVKYVPYRRQIQESVKHKTDETLKMGQRAPLVHTDSGIQRTQRNLLTVYENIDRGDRAPMVPTDRENQRTQNNLLTVYENIDRGDRAPMVPTDREAQNNLLYENIDRGSMGSTPRMG
jgi:hypothetical protein